MVAFKKIVLGTALAASAITAAVPASAQTYYRGGDYRRDNGTGAAIGAGILGVIIGTVIGSATNRSSNSYGYDRSYRNGGWYDGYRYHNGSFYDRQGRRVYDRNTWDQRRGTTYGYANRGYDQSQYQNGYSGTYNNGYNGSYDTGNGYYNGQTYQGQTYGGGAYNGQTYNGQTYNGQTYNGSGYNRGY